MTLAEYIEKHGTGAKRAIAKRTKLRWATVHDIAQGRVVPRVSTARKIEEATGGAVSAAEVLGVARRGAAA